MINQTIKEIFEWKITLGHSNKKSKKDQNTHTDKDKKQYKPARSTKTCNDHAQKTLREYTMAQKELTIA